MKMSHPLMREGLVALVFFSVLTIGAGITFRLVKSSRSYSFDVGGYNLDARTLQANGIYRGVTLYKRPHSSVGKPITYAKFARRDVTKPERWILGNGTTYTYNKNGSIQSQAKFDRMIIDVK